MSAAKAFASASRSNVRDSRGPPRPAGRHLTLQLTLPNLVSRLSISTAQPSSRHAASTASLAFLPQRRRGWRETGSAGGGLLASQSSRASREIRGERPTWPATGSSPPRTARRIVFTATWAYCDACAGVISGLADKCASSAATLASRPWRYAASGPSEPLQVHGREPRAGSTSPSHRSRSSPVAARWSIATKGRAGDRSAPRPAGHPPWLRPPTPRQSSAPVVGFHTSAGPPARGDDRRAPRSRFPAGEAPLMDYLAVLRGARWPPRVGLGLAAGPHTPQRGPRRSERQIQRRRSGTLVSRRPSEGRRGSWVPRPSTSASGRRRSSAAAQVGPEPDDCCVAFAIAPRSCELAIPFAKSTCPVAAFVTAAARRSRQCRQVCWTSIPSKPDHVLRRHGPVPTVARDLDHRAVAWPEGAVISSLPAHALPQLVRWSGACGGPTRARFQGMRDCWAELLHSCDTSGQASRSLTAGWRRRPTCWARGGCFAADRAVKSEQEAGRLGGDRCLACRSDALAQGPGRVRSGCPF